MSEIRSGIAEVDFAACDRLADVIRCLDVPRDEEKPHPSEPGEDDLGNFYLLLVGICHQTQNLEGTVGGHWQRGWDYLQSKLLEQFERDPGLLTPARWKELSADDLAHLFAAPDTGNTLTGLHRRAELVRDLGQCMERRRWSTLKDLYRVAKQRIETGSPNLLDLLAEFQAYSDPVRKKSLFLLGLMRNSAGWRYADEESLGPPVDYHESRGHLRLGTVRIRSAGLEAKIRARRTVKREEDVAIRSAVYRAILCMAQRPGLPNAMCLHYLFWNIFRTVCRRDSPHCTYYPPNGAVDARYRHLVLRPDGDSGCPFAQVCASARVEDRYLEQQFETDWY